ncbi:hypothetical protein RN001_006749 [Aquatica leii]|uniref:Uncharacterized protein n=1 Tax=Aquatica leii TaxID=1421715 RepID=A0AAN7Q928_9COLE|nr:hypothetical protein RN001_006749 [Aquatica leii]
MNHPLVFLLIVASICFAIHAADIYNLNPYGTSGYNYVYPLINYPNQYPVQQGPMGFFFTWILSIINNAFNIFRQIFRLFLPSTWISLVKRIIFWIMGRPYYNMPY